MSYTKENRVGEIFISFVEILMLLQNRTRSELLISLMGGFPFSFLLRGGMIKMINIYQNLLATVNHDKP